MSRRVQLNMSNRRSPGGRAALPWCWHYAGGPRILLFCVCFSVFAVNIFAQNGFLSLDCGNNVSTTSVEGLNFFGDNETTLGWIQPSTSVGQAGSIQLGTAGSNFPSYLQNLRYFPDEGTKNCYNLPVDAESKYLIRTSFLYGNYDGLSQLPIFQYGVGSVSVTTIGFSSADDSEVIELVYQTQIGESQLPICVARIDQSVPFFSAIELRGLPNDSYSLVLENSALYTYSRINFGATVPTLRYPDDPLDRIWISDSGLNGLGGSIEQSTNETIAANFSVPELVMQTARSNNLTTESLSFTTLFPGNLSPTQAISLFAYFWDFDDQNLGAVRSMDLLLNGLRAGSLTTAEPSVMSEALVTNLTGVGGNVNFTIISDRTATVGPIINGLEAFAILPSPSNTADAQSLQQVIRAFNLNGSFGDPCSPFPWDWLNCSADLTPRVQTINLSGKNLSGNIPGALTNLNYLTNLWLDGNQLTGPLIDLTGMSSLVTVHLENNQLSGPIPDQIGDLPNLQELYLSNNSLSGIVPQSLTAKADQNILDLRIDGNNHLCLQLPNGTVSCTENESVVPGPLQGPATKKKPINIGLVAGSIGVGLLAILACLCLLFFCCCKRRQNSAGTLRHDDPDVGPRRAILKWADFKGSWTQSSSLGSVSKGSSWGERSSLGRNSNTSSNVGSDPGRYRPSVGSEGPVKMSKDTMSLRAADVKRATRNFMHKLGEGGFGAVYYGKLASTQQEVAVKVQSLTSRQGAREFTTEVDILSRTKHPNLVSLIGHCQEGKECMLVYEYIAGGTLEDHLYGALSTTPLEWKIRLKIAIDAAIGLEYLHNDCFPTIIHRDVKTNNILLTTTFDAKVADFGLSKFLETQAGHVSTVVKGTSGYLDPEYYESQRLTKKSDVYSFGIVLLEIISGREPLNTNLPRAQWKICDWARRHLQDGELEHVVDKALDGTYNLSAMWKVAELAMTCVEPRSIHRPTMSDVVKELQTAVEVEAEGSSLLSRSERDDSTAGEETLNTTGRHYNSVSFNRPFRYSN